MADYHGWGDHGNAPWDQPPEADWSYAGLRRRNAELRDQLAKVRASLERAERDAEKYWAARSEVKTDGHTRAHYVIQRDEAVARAEKAEALVVKLNEDWADARASLDAACEGRNAAHRRMAVLQKVAEDAIALLKERGRHRGEGTDHGYHFWGMPCHCGLDDAIAELERRLATLG